MLIKPEHVMILEVEDDDNFITMSIVNPVYIYKVGDLIKIRFTFEDPLVIKSYTVIDVLQEVNFIGDGEQYITVFLKELKEDK